MKQTKHRMNIKHCLGFILGGLMFSFISYLAGIWIFGAECPSCIAPQIRKSLVGIISYVISQHKASFITWALLCSSISLALCYFYSREVYLRKKAEEQANIDGLTEAFNHRHFQETLSSEIERAARYGRELSIVMFDLDDFKLYNDTWGHQEGDKLLKWFTMICKKCIRNIDVLARYGGEEFVLILPETDSDSAMLVAERIRDAVEKQSLIEFGKNRGITVSAGIASFPRHGRTRYGLVLNADAALYYAKQQGKNKCFIYEEDQHRSYRANSGHVEALPWDEDLGAIEALSASIDEKDSHLKGHSASVTKYSIMIGDRMHLSVEEMNSLRAAALLHDVGKILTPAEILSKPGPLGSDEWKKIEDHAGLGARMLKRVQQLRSIIPAIKHHHERYDGSGYPSGLVGENIPLQARIIAIADAFDAMTNDRAYKPAMSWNEAIEELKHCSGSQFDPKLVEIFISVLEEEKKKREAA